MLADSSRPPLTVPARCDVTRHRGNAAGGGSASASTDWWDIVFNDADVADTADITYTNLEGLEYSMNIDETQDVQLIFIFIHHFW